MILIANTENESHYRFFYGLSYFLNLRMCGNVSKFKLTFYISCFFLMCMIFHDITSWRNKDNKKLFNFLLLIGLFSTTIYLDRTLIYILFCLHFISPLVISFINNALSMNISFLIYQTAILCVFSFIGFRFVTSSIIYFYSFFAEIFGFDLIIMVQNLIHNRVIDEMEIFKFLIGIIKSFV